MRILLCFSLVIGWGQPAVEAPVAGYLRDSTGGCRAVYGVAGSFVLGPVVAEAPGSPEPPEHVERRGEVLFVVAADGSIRGALPPDAVRALVVEGGLVYATGGELVLRRADASERRWALTGVAALRAMSADYVQVSVEGAEFALRLEPGREALYRLPAAPRQERRR